MNQELLGEMRDQLAVEIEARHFALRKDGIWRGAIAAKLYAGLRDPAESMHQAVSGNLAGLSQAAAEDIFADIDKQLRSYPQSFWDSHYWLVPESLRFRLSSEFSGRPGEICAQLAGAVTDSMQSDLLEHVEQHVRAPLAVARATAVVAELRVDLNNQLRTRQSIATSVGIQRALASQLSDADLQAVVDRLQDPETFAPLGKASVLQHVPVFSRKAQATDVQLDQLIAVLRWRLGRVFRGVELRLAAAIRSPR